MLSRLVTGNRTAPGRQGETGATLNPAQTAPKPRHAHVSQTRRQPYQTPETATKAVLCGRIQDLDAI